MTITHEEYKKTMLWKTVMETVKLGYQCVAQAKDYCKRVRGYTCWPFGGSAHDWRMNRARSFKGKKSIEWFAVVPVGSIVFFKPFAKLLVSKPWSGEWKSWKLWKYGHVATVDYIDNDWVIRTIEQNWATWNWKGQGEDVIRLRWYKGKDCIDWFVLQNT